MMKNIIFDMDGVLMDSWDVMNDAFVKIKFRGKTIDEVIANHKKYITTKPYHSKGEPLSQERYKYVIDVLDQCFEIIKSDPRYKPFYGFLDELKNIKDARFAIVSSNGEKHIRNFIKRTDILFTHALSFEDNPSKEAKVEKITKDWGVTEQDIIYVTDTIADIFELQSFIPKSNLVGCSWGYCGYDLLSKELPSNQILLEFSDIHKVLETKQFKF